MEEVIKVLKEKNLLSHLNEGIQIVNTPQERGMEFAKELLYRIVDKRTLLLLSGGRTPKELYTEIAKDESLVPGAVGQVDERYGKPLHENSNQRMMKDAGLLRYLEMRDIRFYPMLNSHPELDSGSRLNQIPKQVRNDTREKTAIQYDKTLRELFSLYHKTVGILGIGLDGHTAGIPADKRVWEEFDLDLKGKTEYVVDYDDHGKFYNERITMSFLGLSMLDILIVLVFGDDKKKALDSLFESGKEEDIPSRFFKRPDVAKKTLIITDQQI